jgi:iron complex transport system permease protein
VTAAVSPPVVTPKSARRSPVRAAALLLGAVSATALLAAWSLTLGDYPISIPAAAKAVFGGGPYTDVLVIQEWRLPRVLAALLAGAALACSGALLQSLAGNPLASPDVIGVNMGATAAAVAFIVLGIPAVLVPLGAVAGGLATAVLLVLLAWRHTIGAERLVLVGIGLHTALYALKTFLIVRFPDEVVRGAVRWTIGTLYGRTWTDVTVAAVAVALLLPCGLLLIRTLRILELGDDLATGIGLPVQRGRLLVLGTAVGLASIAVALTGPIYFVALAVPFAVRALTGPLTPLTLVLIAVAGGLLLLGADVIAQHALATAVPAGVVTASAGAPFFFLLLWRHHRTGGRS